MATSLECRNSSVRNSLRITYEDYLPVMTNGKETKDKEGNVVKRWQKRAAQLILAPNEKGSLWTSHNGTRIAHIEEIPT